MKTIFWNVDTQYDFMRDDESHKGALPIPGARSIEKNLEFFTKYAYENNIKVVNTADWHTKDSKEFSETPDFINTFPPHCLQNTEGADYIPATKPGNAYAVDWDKDSFDKEKIKDSRNIIIRKDAFNVFEGNKHTDEILDIIKPTRAIVYGVATNYCVNYAVKGLVERGIQVYVVKDAIKEIPVDGQPNNTFKEWEKIGVKFTTLGEYLKD